MSRLLRGIIIVAISAALSGCGATVPYLQEPPSKSGEEQLLVQAIVQSIQCEISNAVHQYIDADKDFRTRNLGRRAGAWLDHWGAQVALTLTIVEKTTLNPTLTGLPPSPLGAVLTLDASASHLSSATRTNKLNYFYTVKDLYNRGTCAAGLQPTNGAPSPLIQSDLKLGNWLFDQLPLSATEVVSYPVSPKNISGQNVLSHQVTFQVTTDAGLNPSTKLIRLSINPSRQLISGSRDRTSDLIVTFGPLDPTQDNRGLTLQAENVHFIQQLGVANSTNLPRFAINRSVF